MEFRVSHPHSTCFIQAKVHHFKTSVSAGDLKSIEQPHLVIVFSKPKAHQKAPHNHADPSEARISNPTKESHSHKHKSRAIFLMLVVRLT